MRLHLLLFVLFCSSCLVDGCNVMYKGASGADGPGHQQIVTEMEATHVRVYFHWRYIQKTLYSIEEDLTVDKLRNNATLIDEWANSANVSWKDHDNRLNDAVNAGLVVIGEVGEGTIQSLPSMADGKCADPAVLGKDLYLAYIYRYSRAVVRRFKQHVHIWQIENELNEAYLASLGSSQRSFHLLNSPWKDWDFLTTLLKTIRMAVKDEQPSAIVTQNLHTDMSQQVHEKTHVRGFYLDAAKDWNDLVDVWSLDGYPNYFGAWPIKANVLGERVLAMKQVVQNKDVFIMETGYPVVNDSSTAPDVVNYSDDREAVYAVEAWNSTIAAGGCGLLYFKAVATAGLATPPGGWTKDDASFIDELSKLYSSQDLISFAGWMLTHAKESSRIKGLVSYGSAWGLMHLDRSPRPAMHALRDAWK